MEPPQEAEILQLEDLRYLLSDLDFEPEDLHDKNLVRYLRARNGSVELAEVMMRNSYHWMREEDVKNLLANYVPPKGWEDSFNIGVTGFDRTGCPVLVIPCGKWDIQKETALGHKEEFVRFVYYQMEKLMTFVRQASKQSDGMRQAVVICDLEGLSLRQVTSIDVVEAVIRTLKAFEANYPETIKAAVILNAPWPFQVIWKLVKTFISEHTHSKLAFLGKDKEKWREAVFKLAELDQFPITYGGTAPPSSKLYIGRDGTWTHSVNQNECEEL